MTTTENPWIAPVQAHQATKAQALEAITELAQRHRDLRAETSATRRELRALCAAVADAGLAHKTEIAAAGGFSRSALYINPLPDREVTP
jgi:hypothetical protein